MKPSDEQIIYENLEILTCVEGSGSKTGSVLSLFSLFNKIFNNCGGNIGGPPVPGPAIFEFR